MQGKALKIHAFGFAFSIGAVAFLLASFSELTDPEDVWSFSNPLIIALACGVLAWGAVDRLIAVVSASIDSAVLRLSEATAGDLDSPVPQHIEATMPDLSQSLGDLFLQVRTNMEQVNSMALFDPVTALANRMHFRNETEALLAAAPAERLDALFFIDLDNFKGVNDTLGHAAGDQLLIMIANRLRSIFPLSGSVGYPPVLGRLAGDEFTVFVPGVQSQPKVRETGAVILRALNEPFSLCGQSVRVGASIGIALRPLHGRALTDLMRAADVAMYHSKENGKGQVQFYNDALAANLASRMKLDSDLRDAFKLKQFGFEFQPQVLLGDRRSVAAEALLRWHHPVDGIRTPDQFIRVAEESGLMAELSDWTLAQAAAVIGRWHRSGYRQRLAINMSKRQFERGSLYERASEALARHEAPIEMLEIEISDRLAYTTGDGVFAEVQSLREAGATISIDNFGSAPIDLRRLRLLPVDRVKIDRTMIADITHCNESRAILQSAVTVLNALGKETVAEGVESQDQFDMLRVMGCKAAQGYVIARPGSEAALRNFMVAAEPAPLRRKA
jgi:diguanylate cyclase (GGDEF)-like protein